MTEFGTYMSALKCSHCREGLILPETTETGGNCSSDSQTFLCFPILYCISDSLWRCRFCSNPFEPDVINEIVKKMEDELYDVLETNPTVKLFEHFIKENSKDLHTKHYLNLIGKVLLSCPSPN